MRIGVNIIMILLSSLILFSISNSIDKINLYNELNTENSFNTNTYEIYYDNNDDPDVAYTYQSIYINEPFENGFGFYFDLDDFDVFKNVNVFKIIEIKALLRTFYSVPSDEESLQVLCAGKGSRSGPKGPEDVFFAVPDGGIPVFTPPFSGWAIFTEKDGSWGTDDGAKYDYKGLPYSCKKEDCKNEYGYWLWVALTQVKSDGEWDDDTPNWIECDMHVPHHCFIGENYNWRERHEKHTCMIHIKIEIEPGPGIENSSIGLIKSIFNK